MRGVMLGRKDSGSVGDLLAAGICILAMCSAMLGFFDCMELLKQKNQVSQVAREYILRMETVGCLTAEDAAALTGKLQSIRVSDVDLSGSTFVMVGYGNQVTLHIRGKLRGKYEIDEIRVSTAKH